MIGELLLKLLEKNRNDPEVKEFVRQKVSTVEGITYHLMSSDEQEYMEEYARAKIQKERLLDVGQVALERLSRVAESIEKGELRLPEQSTQTESQVEPSIPTADETLTAQLRNREEYPTAANYDYWSQQHSKTAEVRQYMARLHEHERKVKQELRSKKEAEQENKHRRLEQQQHQHTLQEQQRKEEVRQQALQKIKQIKEEQQRRDQHEQQFRQFYQEYRAKSPLHAKMQQQYKQKFELPLLEERKLKLQKIRSIRKQPSLTELMEHSRRHDESMQARQLATITNQPVKVSYRSRYHSTLEPPSEQSVKDLYDKKVEYAKKVKEEFKPVVSPRLVEEVQQRFEPKDPLTKRRQKLRGNSVGGEDSDDSDDEEKPKQQVTNRNGDDEDDDDDGSDDGKGDQPEQEPQCAYRNKLGNNYLQFVRNLPKKNRPTKEDYLRRIREEEELEAASRKRIVRPNYLVDLREQHRSYSVTAKRPFDNWQSDLHDSRLNDADKKRRVFMKSQVITERAQRRQLEITHNKLSQNQLLEERQKVDQQYLEAIRAKLALMQV